MNRFSAACAIIALTGLVALRAHAELAAETSPASIAPFYKFLNAASASESPELLRQSTAPHTGKSFKVMSIDVHTLDRGKIVRSYHIEDWIGAVRQLTAN